MKLLFDLFPVILFFATYKFFSNGNGSNACLADQAVQLPWTQEPILLATSVAIAATLVQVAWVKYRHGKVDGMLWVSFAIITVFGGASIYFHNPTFIQWKPTILYWVFAFALAGTPIFTGRNLIRTALEDKMKLPDDIWGRLNMSWVIFFFAVGLANIAAVQYLSCDAWVNFKMFGTSVLMLMFIFAQAAMLAKYVEEDKEGHQ